MKERKKERTYFVLGEWVGVGTDGEVPHSVEPFFVDSHVKRRESVLGHDFEVLGATLYPKPQRRKVVGLGRGVDGQLAAESLLGGTDSKYSMTATDST